MRPARRASPRSQSWRVFRDQPCCFLPSGPASAKSLQLAVSRVRRDACLPERTNDWLDPSIYGYILHYSLREQIYLVVVTLLSFPFLYYSLDLPKLIVNRRDFRKGIPSSISWDLNSIRSPIFWCYAVFF